MRRTRSVGEGCEAEDESIWKEPVCSADVVATKE
jgi:hypothetical protein